MSDTDIKTKLVLDDQATKVLENIKKGFGDTAKEAKASQGNLDWFKSTLSTFAAVNMMPAVHQVYQFGKSFLDAATDGERADHAIASLIMTAQSTGWNQAHAQAREIGDDLDKIAIAAGVSNDALSNAFENLINLSGGSEKSVGAARDQIEQMATVAGVTGMNIEAISTEFGMMQEGVLRTKGALFQLLQTTGIFGTETKKAAAGWAQMTSADRMKALDAALTQISGRMQEAEPSMKQMVQSMESAWAATKETIGDPILRALLPEMNRLVEKIIQSRGSIEEFAQSMATTVSAWVEEASNAVRDGFKWIKDHQEDIKTQIVQAWSFAKSVMQFIIDHKEVLALAYGAKLAAPAVGGAVGAGKAIAGTAAAGVPAIGIAGSAAGATAALGAFSAAIVGVGAAVWQYEKLMGETSGGMSEAEQNLKAIQDRFAETSKDQLLMTRKWTEEESKYFNERWMRARQYAHAARLDGDTATKSIHAMLEQHNAMMQQIDVYDQLNKKFNDLNATGDNTIPMIDSFTAGLESALGKQDSAMALGIAQIIAKNQDLAQSFAFGTNMTASAMDSLANMIKGKSAELDELAKQLEAAADGKRKSGAAPAVPKISIGSATFKIEQNFQSDDPDRVFLAFEKDVNRAVENRLQAITTSPFGV